LTGSIDSVRLIFILTSKKAGGYIMTSKKLGRPKKAETGKTMFIPAHLVKYVIALLRADKAEKQTQQIGLSDETIVNWTSEGKQ
jgi:hypothetical protein